MHEFWRPHSEHQLLDIVARHIVLRLPVKDVQALGQTCTRLSAMVQANVPAEAWLASAALSFPQGHPILSLPAASVHSELLRLSALHVNLRSGQLAALSAISLTHVQLGNPLTFAVAPSGRLMISRRKGQLVMSRLITDAARATFVLQEAWSLDDPLLTRQIDCSFVWTADDSKVCIVYGLANGLASEGVADVESLGLPEGLMGCWRGLVCILDMQARRLEKLEPPWEGFFRSAVPVMNIGTPIFAPNCRFVALPWSVNSNGFEHIQIYSLQDISKWTSTAVIDIPEDDAAQSIVFCPKSAHLAVGRSKQCCVYTAWGTEVTTLRQDGPDGQPISFHHVAWNPAGTCLACRCNQTSAIHLFDARHWTWLDSMACALESSFTTALLFGLHSIVHVCWADSAGGLLGMNWCTIQRSVITGHEIGLGKGGNMLLQMAFASAPALSFGVPHPPRLYESMPALSPDTGFLAIVCPAFA